MITAQKIRGFLLQQPKPVKVRITGGAAGDEGQELTLGRNFTKAAETIHALEPEVIEALDKDGKLLRAKKTQDADAQRTDAAPIPEGLKNDANALMLTHFADLLHRAYQHSTEIAFTKLVEFQERVNDRSASIEARLERTEARNRQLMQDQVDDAFERAAELAEKRAEGEDGFVEQMASTYLASKMGLGTNGASNTNGKKASA
jgi:hypothetical protein